MLFVVDKRTGEQAVAGGGSRVAQPHSHDQGGGLVSPSAPAPAPWVNVDIEGLFYSVPQGITPETRCPPSGAITIASAKIPYDIFVPA